MLIVAKQDFEKWCIWNTVTSEFLGVNLKRDEAALMIAKYKNISLEKGYSRVDHPQPFQVIADIIIDEVEEDDKQT